MKEGLTFTASERLSNEPEKKRAGHKPKVTPREMVAIEKALSVSLAMEQLKKRSPKHKAKRAKE